MPRTCWRKKAASSTILPFPSSGLLTRNKTYRLGLDGLQKGNGNYGQPLMCTAPAGLDLPALGGNAADLSACMRHAQDFRGETCFGSVTANRLGLDSSRSLVRTFLMVYLAFFFMDVTEPRCLCWPESAPLPLVWRLFFNQIVRSTYACVFWRKYGQWFHCIFPV